MKKFNVVVEQSLTRTMALNVDATSAMKASEIALELARQGEGLWYDEIIHSEVLHYTIED